MNEELKPCPFCGGKAIIRTECTNQFVIGCECDKCHARTKRYSPDIKKSDALERISENKQLAIEAWNRRIGDER